MRTSDGLRVSPNAAGPRAAEKADNRAGRARQAGEDVAVKMKETPGGVCKACENSADRVCHYCERCQRCLDQDGHGFRRCVAVVDRDSEGKPKRILL